MPFFGAFLAASSCATLKINRTSPNGCSYIHLISTAAAPDAGILIESVRAKVE
jgi:hypothetical protein